MKDRGPFHLSFRWTLKKLPCKEGKMVTCVMWLVGMVYRRSINASQGPEKLVTGLGIDFYAVLSIVYLLKLVLEHPGSRPKHNDYHDPSLLVHYAQEDYASPIESRLCEAYCCRLIPV
jgi:hypothetical protein